MQDTQWDIIRLAQQQLSAGMDTPPKSVLTVSDVISQPLPSSDVKWQNERAQDRIQQSLSWAREHCVGRRKSLKMESRLASAPADMTTNWREKSPEVLLMNMQP